MVKTKGYIITFEKKGRTGRFKGSRTFPTKKSAMSAIKTFKGKQKELDKDIPAYLRDRLFFNHRINKL